MSGMVPLGDVVRYGFPLEWLKRFLEKNNIKIIEGHDSKNLKPLQVISQSDSDKMRDLLANHKFENYDPQKHYTLREIADKAKVSRITVVRQLTKMGLEPYPVRKTDKSRFVGVVSRKKEKDIDAACKSGISNQYRTVTIEV